MADGNIDNLNFGVLLSDTDFDRQIDAVKAKARQFNTEVSKLLDFQIKISSTDIIKAEGVERAKEMAGYINDMAAKLNSLGGKNLLIGDADKLNETLQRILGGLDDLNNKSKENKEIVSGINSELSRSQNLVSTIAKLTGLTFGAAGVKQFVSSLVKVTGEFEVQKMALTSMLQDAAKADEIFNTLRQRALESPYTFQDLTKYAKQLTAFNIGADQLVETERRLADVAAGLGVDMGRIILAYGQVKAAGVLKGTELRQFTEAGVPLLQSLAEQIMETEGHAIGLAEVFQRITKKEIPFEMVEEAFRRMTDEGGKFYKMQEVLVETLQGKIGKLRDVWQQALYDIGTSQDGVLKGTVDTLTWFISHLEDIGKVLKPVIWGFGAYYTALALAAAGQKALQLATFVKEFIVMAKNLGLATAAMTAFGSATKAAAVDIGLFVAATVAIVAVAKKFNEASRSVAEFNEELKAVHEESKTDNSFEVEKEKINVLMGAINDSNRAYAERKRALDELKTIIPEYHANLTKEGELIDNNKEAIERYIAAKEKSARMSLLESELGRLIALQQKAQDEVNQTQEVMDKINAASPAPGAVTPAGMTPLDVALAPGKLDAATTKLNNVATAIEGVKTQMASLLAEGGGEETNEPKWDPLQKAKGLKELLQEAEQNIYAELDKSIAKIDQDLAKDMEKNTDEYLKTIQDRIKAIEEFQKFLADWEATGAKTGEGVTRKLSGFYIDYKEKDIKIADDYNDKLNDLKARLGETSEFFQVAKKRLDEWRKSLEDANREDFKEKVTGLVDELFREGLKGFDLTDWNDKTLAQIQAIREAILNLEVPDSWKEFLDEETLAAVEKALKEMGQSMIDNTIDPEAVKKYAKYAKQMAKYISDAGEAMTRLGEATGNAGLADAGEAVKAIGQNLSAAADGYAKTGHWIGAVVGGVMDLFNQITGAISKSNEEMKKMEQTILSIKITAESESFKKLLSGGTDGIFGDNFVRGIKNAVDGLSAVQKKLESLSEWIRQYKEEQAKYMMGGVGIFYGLGGDMYKGIENTLIQTKHSFWKGDEFASIARIAEQFQMEVFDQFGNLNASLLQKILDTYGDLNDGLREWLTNAIEYSKEYEEAMKQIEESTKDVFDNLASDMADTFIDNFLRIGNAVDDLSGVFVALGETILKSFLQSYILENILNKYEEQAKNALTKYANKQMTPEEYAAWLSEFSDNVKRDSETLAPAINGMIDAFKDRGLLGTDKEAAESLGSGIKGISEDTANLLASYINAMRADLFYMRVLQEAGWKNVAAIAEHVTSPTLNEYLAQLAANTFNNDLHTQQILMELQSVIGAPGTTGAVVRVERTN